jgi:hypothetical protein
MNSCLTLLISLTSYYKVRVYSAFVLFERSVCFCFDAKSTVACSCKYRVVRSHLTVDV